MVKILKSTRKRMLKNLRNKELKFTKLHVTIYDLDKCMTLNNYK